MRGIQGVKWVGGGESVSDGMERVQGRKCEEGRGSGQAQAGRNNVHDVFRRGGSETYLAHDLHFAF